MNTPKAVLKSSHKRSDGTYPIYIEYVYDRDNRTLFKTNKRVKKEQWSTSKRQVRSNHPDYQSINDFVEVIRRKVESVLDTAIKHDIEPTIAYVKEQMNHKVLPKSNKRMQMEDALTEWIEANTDRVTADVIKDYKALRKHLQGYESSRKQNLGLSDLNARFHDDFIRYLENDVITPSGKKGLAKNTVGKQTKNLKVFLRYCFKHEWTKPFSLEEMKKVSAPTENIYLNEVELDMLMALDLSSKPHLERTRDWFVVGCETGLRYSDLSRLSLEDIQDDRIVLTTKKTLARLIIPISSRLRKVLDKYPLELPKPIEPQAFNRQIKEVGKLAGIDQPIRSLEARGNRKEEVRALKFELISAHTARRSFCTNWFKQGVPPLLIRRISGHTTEKAFLRYICIDEEEAVEMLLQQIPFTKNTKN